MKRSNIIIDKNICTLCENCIKICGSKTLEISNKSIVQTSPGLCCSCGHCAAVCLQNAITASEENNRVFTIKNIDASITDFEKLLISKRSVREFQNKEIEKNILDKFIFYSEKAPSSSNARKREYYIITDKGKILELEKAVLKKFNSLKVIVNPVLIGVVKIFNKKLSQDLSLVRNDIAKLNKEFDESNFPILRNAPCVVCIIAPKRAVQAKDDCIIAQQYMMLYAQSLGIGSCIIGYAQYAHKSIEKVLQVKKGYLVYAVAVFGYPKFIYKKEIKYLKKPETTWI